MVPCAPRSFHIFRNKMYMYYIVTNRYLPVGIIDMDFSIRTSFNRQLTVNKRNKPLYVRTWDGRRKCKGVFTFTSEMSHLRNAIFLSVILLLPYKILCKLSEPKYLNTVSRLYHLSLYSFQFVLNTIIMPTMAWFVCV